MEEKAQSNRMCYGSIKLDGVGKRVMMDEGVWKKKHNLTECATGMAEIQPLFMPDLSIEQLMKTCCGLHNFRLNFSPLRYETPVA